MTVVRKKLIEVALPLDAINEASAREKSVPRRGHPQTMHLWWARRPLAACRAVIFAQMVDDPSAWPDVFPTEDAQGRERQRLFGLITDLVKWENSGNERIIFAARAEIARSLARNRTGAGTSDARDAAVLRIPQSFAGLKYETPTAADVATVRAYLADLAPPVHDPFAGGASIPIEAQRLGIKVDASDLNPVAVLINKALLQIPTQFEGKEPLNPEWQKKTSHEKAARSWKGAQGLAEDVRYYGRLVGDSVTRKIGKLYPEIVLPKEFGGGTSPAVAWMWARTVASPNPAFAHAHVPLISTFWLSKRDGKEVWLEPKIDRKNHRWRCVVRRGAPSDKKVVDKGTKVGRGDFRCLLSGDAITGAYIRSEAKQGRLGVRLLAVAVDLASGRAFVDATDEAEKAAAVGPSSGGPDTDLPERALGFRIQAYGIVKHRDMFSPRQLTALATLSASIVDIWTEIVRDITASGSDPAAVKLCNAYADSVLVYLALALGRTADYNSTSCTWNVIGGSVRSTFSRHALQMTWDYYETNPLAATTGSWSSCLSWVPDVLDSINTGVPASVCQRDATEPVNIGRAVVSTDPPYYNNIGYADLSDFFYVWHRLVLRNRMPDLFGTLLVPKAKELIATPYRFDGDEERAKLFFEAGLRSVFERIRTTQADDFPITIYYAFKQEESDEVDDASGEHTGYSSTGWETMLAGLIDSGVSIQGTWPMRTERSGRTIGIGTNALASSVVLVCRKRSASATTIDRATFRRLLRAELPPALRYLQVGNIAPVDMAQASIGPGMAIFSRHAKVLEADGSPMGVKTALQIINQALDEFLMEQEGEFDPDTRFAVTWFETRAFEIGAYGDAETLAKARNVAVSGVKEAGIIHSSAGKVRLLKRDELPEDWDPKADQRLSIWEATQQLIKRLESKGEQAAADLLAALGTNAGPARDLAYRLYATCERKGWADEARAYNGLVVAWPELEKLVAQVGAKEPTQRKLL